MYKVNLKKISLFAVILFFIQSVFLYSENIEKIATEADRTSLSVTIYNNNLALVKDSRNIKLDKGKNTLVFKDVSAKIKPETAILTSKSVKVLEQNFEFDLLTPQSLMKKFVGKEITVVRENKVTGKENIEKAKILSINNGIVLQFANRIETEIKGRIVYPSVPDNLREKPTLTMLVHSSDNKNRNMELIYLTEGFSWKADYVAELTADNSKLNMAGWITLVNKSGISYEKARLQLVAGDVNRVMSGKRFDNIRYLNKAVRASAPETVQREELFEYHLYSVPGTTSIKNNESKQISLLNANGINCKKEFILKDFTYLYGRHYQDTRKKIKVGVYINFKNSRKNRLGIPLPEGVVRVYKKDSRGSLQFIGENRIHHTPENEIINLKLGNAFDITAYKMQTDYKKHHVNGKNVFELSYKFEINNAKKNKVTVKIIEQFPGQWKICEESSAHNKLSSNSALWRINVPPKGKKFLTYKVEIRR